MGADDIARLRQQIALEYEAANRIFTDFTATARHEYITARQANIEACFNELQQHMSPQEAMQAILDVEQEVYGKVVLHNTTAAGMQTAAGGSI